MPPEQTDTQRLARLEAGLDEMRAALRELADSMKTLARQEIELRGVISDGQRTGARIGDIEGRLQDTRDLLEAFRNRFLGVWSAIGIAAVVIVPLGSWGVNELLRLRDDNIRQGMTIHDLRGRIEKLESSRGVRTSACNGAGCDEPQPLPPEPILPPGQIVTKS
jgi:hypothetical protein